MKRGVQGYPAYQYSLFRIIFGSYLLLHFLFLLPAAPDIWSSVGILADPALNFTFGTFPNLLNVLDSPSRYVASLPSMRFCPSVFF